jgi:hypothetical protein
MWKLFLVMLAFLPSLASADVTDCRSIPDLGRTELAAARVRQGVNRVNFRNSSDCSDAAAGCVRKGYVVPGNDVIVTWRTQNRACAVFISPKGAEFWGWLPNSSLAIATVPETPAPGWIGRWSRIEADIRIAPARGGKLSISGEATYGALDPDRVRRGAVNVGEIAGIVKPEGNALAFAMSSKGARTVTVPYTSAGEYDCSVKMQRVGRWLLVQDNGGCGGMNVRFDGIYERARRR